MTPGGRYEGLDCRTLYSRKSKPTPQRYEGWHTRVLAAIGASLPQGGSVKACRPSPNPPLARSIGDTLQRSSSSRVTAYIQDGTVLSPLRRRRNLTTRFDPPGGFRIRGRLQWEVVICFVFHSDLGTNSGLQWDLGKPCLFLETQRSPRCGC